MSGSKPGDVPIERTSVERGRSEAAAAEPSEAAAFRAALATSPIFSQLPDAERESLLETGKLQRLEAGKLVFRSGDPATQVFCVLTGSVTIETADSRAVLNRLGSGEMFGEIGVIEDCCRTASVRAAEPCALLAIDQADFLRAARVASRHRRPPGGVARAAPQSPDGDRRNLLRGACDGARRVVADFARSLRRAGTWQNRGGDENPDVR